MASGYVDVPHTTYDQWKANTLGNEYDLDGSYGCQCWDYASLFWRNVGFAAGYPLTGPNHSAYEIWTVNKEANRGDKFYLIYDKTQIKRGDIIVMNATASNPAGHITFADEDYNGTNSISCMGQNQGGTPSPGGGTAVTINTLGLGDFLGVFRYVDWVNPTPPTPTRRTGFPWFILSRKLNNKRNGNMI
jgi:hypothetical protein